VSKAAICAGLTALLALGAQVHAADILPPAPSLDSPALRGRFDGDSGAYLRADAGFGQLRARSASSTFTTPLPGFQIEATRLDHAPLLGLGAGYQFNEFVRADLTGEYRGSASYSARASYADPTNCGSARCADAYAGAFRSMAVMGNVYGQIGSWFDVTPFIGLGLGFARTSFAPLSLAADGVHGAGRAQGVSQIRPAFALMAGGAWDLSSTVKIEAGYRYMILGSARSGAMVCAPATGPCAGQVQKIGLASHDLRIGLRYGLASGAILP